MLDAKTGLLTVTSDQFKELRSTVGDVRWMVQRLLKLVHYRVSTGGPGGATRALVEKWTRPTWPLQTWEAIADPGLISYVTTRSYDTSTMYGMQKIIRLVSLPCNTPMSIFDPPLYRLYCHLSSTKTTRNLSIWLQETYYHLMHCNRM